MQAHLSGTHTPKTLIVPMKDYEVYLFVLILLPGKVLGWFCAFITPLLLHTRFMPT